MRRHSGKKDQKTNMIASITNQGKVRFMFYEGSDEAMTPFSGFVPLAAFFEK